MRFFARKVGPTLNQALNVQGFFFWPPQTRSTECINWLPPSAPCSWDVTFWMATTCVISRIESKHIQHHPTFVFSKNLAVKLIFQKKSEEIVQDVWQNQTSQPLKFPRFQDMFFAVSGYIMVHLHLLMEHPQADARGHVRSDFSHRFEAKAGLCHDMKKYMILCAGQTTWTLKFKVYKYHKYHIIST